MTLLNIVDRYSVKEDRTMKKICAPLAHIGIPYLWYYFIEADGTFGTLSNDIEYVEYYIASNMHLTVPYYSHPSYFKSGYVFTPCTFKDYQQKTVKSLYSMDYIFLVLKAQETKVEGFGFYNRNLNSQDLLNYLPNIDLLEKFICYFKREAAHLIKKQRDFNIQSEIGQDFFKKDNSLPLFKNNLKTQNFLKDVYHLSPQEERCLELFKQGYTAQASASILNISNRTVEAHINNVKKKFKCHSKLELLNY